MPEGGRDLGEYEAQLGFDRRDLEGAVVLDLGAGPKVRLARQLEAVAVHAQVVSFSPDFSDSQYGLQARAFSDGPLVAGVGQNLPFADESFDHVLALQVFQHLPSEQAFVDFISEISRVLATGGTANIGPAPGMQGIYSHALNEHEYLGTYLSSQGVQASIIETAEGVVPKVRVYDDLTGNSLPSVQPSTLVLQKLPIAE